MLISFCRGKTRETEGNKEMTVKEEKSRRTEREVNGNDKFGEIIKHRNKEDKDIKGQKENTRHSTKKTPRKKTREEKLKKRKKDEQKERKLVFLTYTCSHITSCSMIIHRLVHTMYTRINTHADRHVRCVVQLCF